MSKLEFNKLFLTGWLLLLVCVCEIIDGSDPVVHMSKHGVKVHYPFYDMSTKEFSFEPVNYFERTLMWWVNDLGDRVIILVMFIICLIRPDFSRWKYSLWIPWIFYAFITGLNRMLALGKYPVGWVLELFMLICQIAYTVHCYELNQENR